MTLRVPPMVPCPYCSAAGNTHPEHVGRKCEISDFITGPCLCGAVGRLRATLAEIRNESATPSGDSRDIQS